jgi:hypothetical protein
MAFSLRKERPTGLAAPARSQEPQRHQIPGAAAANACQSTKRERQGNTPNAPRTTAKPGTLSASIIPADIRIFKSLNDYFSLGLHLSAFHKSLS